MTQIRRVAIVRPLRTAVAKFFGGLQTVPVEELAAQVIKALVAQSGVDPERIDDIIFAQGYPNGEAPAIGRWAGLAAGLPLHVPGYQVDRRCGSGVQAIANGAMMVQTGVADVVIAGGAESMSNVEYYTTDMRGGARSGSVQFHDRLQRGRERSQPNARFGVISGMIETAENLAREYQITREASDEFAMASHQKAAAAAASGKFKDEIVPVSVPQKRGDALVFDADEGPRADTNMATLSKLKPINADGTVTAGNASQQNDAAAACLLVAEDKLASLNLEPMGYFVGWAAVGCHPATMGIGPVPAVQRLFEKTKFSWDKIDLVELNEAFACQVLSVLKGWDWQDDGRLNVNGSGISLGHPIGATGGRILSTMLHELKRRKARYGLETMCIGGGQGIATIIENAAA